MSPDLELRKAEKLSLKSVGARGKETGFASAFSPGLSPESPDSPEINIRQKNTSPKKGILQRFCVA
jgi:hypothetical protein